MGGSFDTPSARRLRAIRSPQSCPNIANLTELRRRARGRAGSWLGAPKAAGSTDRGRSGAVGAKAARAQGRRLTEDCETPPQSIHYLGNVLCLPGRTRFWP